MLNDAAVNSSQSYLYPIAREWRHVPIVGSKLFPTRTSADSSRFRLTSIINVPKLK